MLKIKLISAIAGVCISSLAIAPAAYAGLIASVSYDQVLTAEDSAGTGAVTQSLVGASLPVSQTLTASADQGDFITGNYIFRTPALQWCSV